MFYQKKCFRTGHDPDGYYPCMSTNPFEPSAQIDVERGVSGTARLLQSGFLFRIVEFRIIEGNDPVVVRLRYSGWWFVQRVDVNGVRAWTKISWLNLSRQIEFVLPAQVAPSRNLVQIEINFRPGLLIQRFRVWVDGQMQFDQIS